MSVYNSETEARTLYLWGDSFFPERKCLPLITCFWYILPYDNNFSLAKTNKKSAIQGKNNQTFHCVLVLNRLFIHPIFWVPTMCQLRAEDVYWWAKTYCSCLRDAYSLEEEKKQLNGHTNKCKIRLWLGALKASHNRLFCLSDLILRVYPCPLLPDSDSPNPLQLTSGNCSLSSTPGDLPRGWSFF